MEPRCQANSAQPIIKSGSINTLPKGNGFE